MKEDANAQTPYEDLGRFIVAFQHVEAALTEQIVLMAKGDDEQIRILANGLEFGKRVNAAGVMFARFSEIHSRNPTIDTLGEFRKLLEHIKTLAMRRNQIVHSRYWNWVNVDGEVGLLRQNSQLKVKTGERVIEEEGLILDSLKSTISNAQNILIKLEHFRLSIVDDLYPDTA